jgi:hypothetical protein
MELPLRKLVKYEVLPMVRIKVIYTMYVYMRSEPKAATTCTAIFNDLIKVV